MLCFFAGFHTRVAGQGDPMTPPPRAQSRNSSTCSSGPKPIRAKYCQTRYAFANIDTLAFISCKVSRFHDPKALVSSTYVVFFQTTTIAHLSILSLCSSPAIQFTYKAEMTAIYCFILQFSFSLSPPSSHSNCVENFHIRLKKTR